MIGHIQISINFDLYIYDSWDDNSTTKGPDYFVSTVDGAVQEWHFPTLAFRKLTQLLLFADRTSTHKMQSNQARLYFSSLAYVLIQAFRRLGLVNTEMAKAQCETIRLKLFKIGARVRVTVRKVWVCFAEGYPYKAIFTQVMNNIEKIPANS